MDQTQLRLVDVDVSLDATTPRPDFVFIGPNRTGSTWLYHRFAGHPEVFLSTPKEIHYFATLRRPQHPLHQTDRLSWYLDHFSISDEERQDRQADAEKRLGRDFAPKLRGEASASYAAGVDDDRLAELVALFPDLRVVMTIRNPVERAWSHAKFNLTILQKRKLQDVPAEEIEKQVTNAFVLRCGRYTELYERWSRYLGADRVHCILFDRIQSDPIGLCQDVAQFLGVDDDARLFDIPADRGRNATEKTSSIPEPWFGMLNDYYAEEIRALRQHFGSLDW